MNHWNLSPLDATAKRSLEVLVRPAFFRAIQPWLSRATPDMKQRIVQAASFITKAKRATRPLVRNDHQLERQADSIYQSADKVALTSQPPAGKNGASSRNAAHATRAVFIDYLGGGCCRYQQTLNGSFSIVSKRIIASKR